jgi:hypothetical protein
MLAEIGDSLDCRIGCFLEHYLSGAPELPFRVRRLKKQK